MSIISPMKNHRVQKLLDSLPRRKFKGDFKAYKAFKETMRLLQHYSFTDEELNLLEAEIGEIKKQLSVGKGTMTVPCERGASGCENISRRKSLHI